MKALLALTKLLVFIFLVNFIFLRIYDFDATWIQQLIIPVVVQRYFLDFKISNSFFGSWRLSQKEVMIIESSATL
jgi:hypothetical protein